jgi:prephenate dehydrogenase
MAWMSHLPQLASTALGATLAVATTEAKGDLPLTPGPGTRDATRLAMSALEMWRPLLERAPATTLAALDELEANIHRLRIALDKGDWDVVAQLWTRAADWRTSLPEGEGR